MRKIPFIVCGGLSANGYGSERELNDTDFFVPGEHFLSLVKAGDAYISKAAAHYQEEGWDLIYAQFKYEGVKVEVGNADGARIFDAGQQAWTPLDIDFTRYNTVRLLGLDLPLMLKEDLVRYKSVLSRAVDIEDIRAINRGCSG